MNENITTRRIAKHTKNRYFALTGLLIGIVLACVDLGRQDGLSAWPILIIVTSTLSIAYESNQIRILKKMNEAEQGGGEVRSETRAPHH
jgi:hypothetical protein